MDDNDLRQTIQFLSGAGADDEMIKKIKSDIKEKGLTDKINEIENQYAPLINEYLKRIEKSETQSNEEKARILMELKKSLSQSEQRQFEKFMKMLKIYISGVINEKH